MINLSREAREHLKVIYHHTDEIDKLNFLTLECIHENAEAGSLLDREIYNAYVKMNGWGIRKVTKIA